MPHVTNMKGSCGVPEPERVPLIFVDQDFELPAAFSHSIVDLKSAARKHLFLWKEFPAFLPESILTVSNSPLNTVFLIPEFDECENLSKDADGNLKPLTRQQLNQLRQTAQFDVPSANFVGECHTWKISSFFLKGTCNIYRTLKTDLYGALTVLVIGAHDRIVGHTFSIRCSLFSFFHDFLLMTFDLIFGWPHVNHGDVDYKLLDERLRFITCELSVKSSQRKRVMDFWDAYEEFTRLPRDTPPELNDSKHPPYRFITPSRIPIDLRLHNSSLLDRCLTVISELRHPARVGWFQDFKEKAISYYQGEGKSLSEIKRLVRQEGLRRYASRLFEALRRDDSLKSIGSSIAEPLIQQATFSLILAEAKQAFTESWIAYREKAERDLRRAHSILYHIKEWRTRQMNGIQQEYFEAHKFDVHELVLSKCLQANLEQHAFFVSRDLTFLRDRERLLREQLEKSASFPDTQFVFRIQSQLLRHWKVYRKTVSFTTNYELVDTVLLNRPPSKSEPTPPVKCSIKRAVPTNQTYELLDRSHSSGPPRADQELGPQDFDVHTASPKRVFCNSRNSNFNVSLEKDSASVNPGLSTKKSARRTEFVLQSCLIYKTSTRYFLWRWLAFLVCTYSWLLRSGQLFFITVPFRSVFSLTVLFRWSPIYLKLDLDPSTGYLFPDKSVYQDTLFSRIRRTWFEVRAARRAFDLAPSGGMLDKTAARPWHWVWSYVFRGFLGSLALLIFWPPLCVLVSTISILIGLTLPVLVPLTTLVLHLLGLLFWDAYKPTSKHNRLLPVFELIIGHLFIRTILQTILALFTAFVLCPLWSAIRLLWAFVRFIFRSVWDALVFHIVIRNLARVPAREDFMVKRIAGPGTASNHFYQARPIHVLVMLVGQLELLELQLWQRQMENLANKPIEAYHQLVDSLAWLSLVPKADGDLYSSLNKHTKRWHAEIQEKLNDRSQALQIRLKPSQLQRIKLSDRELHQTLKMGTELTECFFVSRIAPRLKLLNEDFGSWWSAFSLNKNDYLGLCTNLLGHIFGEQLFNCISETDRVFPLQISDSSRIRDFQDFIIELLSPHYSVRSLNTVGLPGSGDPSVFHSTTNVAPNPVDEETLSLSSDAFTSDRYPQRCTVIPMKSVASHSTDNLFPSGTDENGLAASFVFPESLKATQQRAVTNPIAFIHVDLPPFPLSAFAPFSCRRLPLPLKSSPSTPMINGVPCLACSQLEKSFACCICPTKTSADRVVLSSVPQRGGESDLKEWACADHDDDILSPCSSGMATMLAKEERDLRKQLLGWNWSPETDGNIGSSIERDSSCQSPSSFWNQLFGLTANRPIPRSSVITAVEHLGYVYHPVIITLLMHSRDREHNPLDFSHPAIQRVVAMITTPQEELNMLRRLRSGVTSRHVFPDYPYPTLLALSVGSQLAPDSPWLQNPSLKTSQKASASNNVVSRRVFSSTGAIYHGSFALDKEASQSLLSPVTRAPGRNLANGSPVFSVPHSRTVKNGRALHLRNAEVSAIRPSVNNTSKRRPDTIEPLLLFGWNDTSAAVAGCWSVTDAAPYEASNREHSIDTTSASLYGTEDVATTEDLDETEDALSLSSVNHCDFMEKFFNGVSGPGKFPLFEQGAEQPALPLAVPELLTTSATTAGSTENEVLPELLECSRLVLHSSCTDSATTLAANSDATFVPASAPHRYTLEETHTSSHVDENLKDPLRLSGSTYDACRPVVHDQPLNILYHLNTEQTTAASTESETNNEATLKTILIV